MLTAHSFLKGGKRPALICVGLTRRNVRSRLMGLRNKDGSSLAEYVATGSYEGRRRTPTKIMLELKYEQLWGKACRSNNDNEYASRVVKQGWFRRASGDMLPGLCGDISLRVITSSA